MDGLPITPSCELYLQCMEELCSLQWTNYGAATPICATFFLFSNWGIMISGMVVKATKGGSMTEELYQEWLKEVFSKRGAKGLFCTPTLLLVDCATSHTKHYPMKNIITQFIPKGCTPLLQPLDVSINKPFKSYVKEFWREFIDTPLEEQRFTPSGNRQRVIWILIMHYLQVYYVMTINI